jgi:hypothetical protein
VLGEVIPDQGYPGGRCEVGERGELGNNGEAGRQSKERAGAECGLLHPDNSGKEGGAQERRARHVGGSEAGMGEYGWKEAE